MMQGRKGATPQARIAVAVGCVTLAVMVLAIGASVASAATANLNVTVDGLFSNQTMYNVIYYDINSTTKLTMREVTFHCTGSRSNNENRLWCYSDGYLKANRTWLDVVGGRTYRWDFANFTTIRYKTKWTCTFKADLNNEPDKSATKSITL